MPEHSCDTGSTYRMPEHSCDAGSTYRMPEHSCDAVLLNMFQNIFKTPNASIKRDTKYSTVNLAYKNLFFLNFLKLRRITKK